MGKDFKVFTEYSADFWVEIIKAGFTDISTNTLEGLSSMAICANKREKNYKRYLYFDLVE
jgi:hypothetical protein